MGAICIPKAMEQMGGVFGCKVDFDYNKETKSVEFSFTKKTIIDFLCDIFSGNAEKFDQNSYVMHVLEQIKEQVGKADNGEFGKMVEKYRSNNDLIDFKEIRRTFRSAMKMEVPPLIYLGEFKELYLQNLRRGIYTDKSIKIFRDDIYEDVSDENLEALCEAINEIRENEAAIINIDEPDPRVFERLRKRIESTRPSFKIPEAYNRCNAR